MEKKFSSEVPVHVERNGSIRVLNYGVREATEVEILEEWKKFSMSGQGDAPTDDFVNSHRYVNYSVRVPMARWSYNGIVEAIIRDKYTADEMEAITNNMNVIVAEFFNVLVTDGVAQAVNYLITNIEEDNMSNFKAMQEWRAMAKMEARNILK